MTFEDGRVPWAAPPGPGPEFPPEPPTRSRAPLVVLLGAVVAVLLIGFAVALSGDDRSGDITTSTPGIGLPAPADDATEAGPNTVDDPALPATTAAPTGSTPMSTKHCPAADGSSPRTMSFDSPQPPCIDTSKRFSANVETSMGSFVIELDAQAAPLTVNNFVVLARFHFYDDLIFHRVIPGFMVQGGDPEGLGNGGPGYEFPDELPEAGAYQMYSVAMANAGADTNGSQFFVVSGPTGVGLPPAYSLFGTVVSGTEVIDAIQSVETSSIDDRPRTPIVIRSVQIVEG